MNANRLRRMAVVLVAMMLAARLSAQTEEVLRRTVLEEVTGTWCQWCIRGVVGMKHDRELFGDRFIGISVHVDDVMDTGAYFDLGLTSYPTCRIDRNMGYKFNPYETAPVAAALEVPPTADVSVVGVWNDDGTQVTATSVTTLLTDDEGYGVAYVLVADSLQGDSACWNQKNTWYSGGHVDDPDLQYYCDKPKTITDMVYNDVMVGSSYDADGQNLATPFSGPFGAGTVKHNSYTLTLPAEDELARAIRQELVSVVAIVTNGDGTVANAAMARVTTSETAISSVKASDLSARVYTLSGQLAGHDVGALKALPRGIYVVGGRKVVVK